MRGHERSLSATIATAAQLMIVQANGAGSSNSADPQPCTRRAAHFRPEREGVGRGCFWTVKGDVYLLTVIKKSTHHQLFLNYHPRPKNKEKPVSLRAVLIWRSPHYCELTALWLWYSPGCAVFTNLTPHCQIFFDNEHTVVLLYSPCKCKMYFMYL